MDHLSKKWKNIGIINDLKGSAPEGLMSLAADNNDNFYAVWLDTRTGGNNQIYFSSLSGKVFSWSKNTVAHHSPDGRVCEYCKPNIAVKGSEVAIMVRNWLNGSRDLYFIKSSNGDKSFAAAQKSDMDTWKLNGCNMDGGGIIIDHSNVTRTTWSAKDDMLRKTR